MTEEKPLDYCDDKSVVPYGDNRGAPAFHSTKKEVKQWRKQKDKSDTDYFHTKYEELKGEYDKLKDNYDLNEMVNNSEISFKPIIGKKYYLYQRNNKTTFLSLVQPEQWGHGALEFKGCFKLDSHDVWKKTNP